MRKLKCFLLVLVVLLLSSVQLYAQSYSELTDEQLIQMLEQELNNQEKLVNQQKEQLANLQNQLNQQLELNKTLNEQLNNLQNQLALADESWKNSKKENLKNKIITISGEPASGKSTVVQEIKNKYEKMGYNIHIVSVGNVFRELVKKEYLKTYPDKTEASLADIQNDKEFMSKLHSIDGMVDSEVARKGREINGNDTVFDGEFYQNNKYYQCNIYSYSINESNNELKITKRDKYLKALEAAKAELTNMSKILNGSTITISVVGKYTFNS